MQSTDSASPRFTPSMLDALIKRWKAGPTPPPTKSFASASHRMAQARGILVQAIGAYLPHLAPNDQALYARLVATREIDGLRAHFFDCFDLMVRTRGAAIAVLRIQELHRLLRDTPSVPQPARRECATHEPLLSAPPM